MNPKIDHLLWFSTLVLVLIPGALSLCKEDWSIMNSKCIKFFPKRASFGEAEQACEELGGHLVSITSEDENIAVYEVVQWNGDAWIGGFRAEAGGDKFLWTDGSEWSYTNWWKPPTEPNNLNGNENCVEINYYGDSGWNDNQCHKSLYYVCQTPPEPDMPDTTTPLQPPLSLNYTIE